MAAIVRVAAAAIANAGAPTSDEQLIALFLETTQLTPSSRKAYEATFRKFRRSLNGEVTFQTLTLLHA